MLLRDVKEKLYPAAGLEHNEYIMRKYAVDIFDTLIDIKKLTVFDQLEDLGDVTENVLLLGFWDWQMYSDSGTSLFWNDDITMRLYRMTRLSQAEIINLTNGKDLLSVQAEILKQAGDFILNTLGKIQSDG